MFAGFPRPGKEHGLGLRRRRAVANVHLQAKASKVVEEVARALHQILPRLEEDGAVVSKERHPVLKGVHPAFAGRPLSRGYPVNSRAELRLFHRPA